MPFFFQSSPVQVMLSTGVLVKAITQAAADADLSRKSTNVLQEVVEAPCTDVEIVKLGSSLINKALDLLATRPGISVMKSLAEKLVRRHEAICYHQCGVT